LHYSKLLADLKNQYNLGQNQYPKDLTSAYRLLVHYDPGTIPSPTAHNSHTSPVAALSEPEPNEQVPTMTTNSGLSLFQECGVVLTQQGISSTISPPITDLSYNVPPEWVLLDSQSTISVFNNENLVVDIRPSDEHMYAFTNGGHQVSTEVANITNLGTVWFNRDLVANILSLSQVRRVCKVTMDSSVSPSITVHKTDGSTLVFHERPDGLYVHNTGISPPTSAVSGSVSTGYTFLQTVSDNKNFFTQREIDSADRARALYRALGRPSQSQFEDILQKNLIRNCPVTVDDAK
jgi:hypothetical protein